MRLADQVARRSRELFQSGYYCAESVLLAISEAKGIESELIPKIATGFCSGMGRSGGQCGALSGGIMGISLLTGRSKPGETVDKNYAKVRELTDSFQARFGSKSCLGLLGLDLGTNKGQISFRDQNLIENCYLYAEEAARMAMEVLEKEG